MNVLFTLLALASASPVAPSDGPLRSGELEDLCSTSADSDAALCSMFLRGAFESMMVVEGTLASDESIFCLPSDGVTLFQVRDGFLALMHDQPDRRAALAGATLLDSLQASFPCSTTGLSDEPDFDALAVHVLARQ